MSAAEKIKREYHGMNHHPLKTVFDNMKKRCYSPGNNRWKRYGGRGIRICALWLKSRSEFYMWALSSGYKRGLTIDRINVDGHYTPRNCRWATHTDQQNNTSRNRRITFKGETKTIAEWARALGVNYRALQHRIQRDWPKNKVFTQPFRARRYPKAGLA